MAISQATSHPTVILNVIDPRITRPASDDPMRDEYDRCLRFLFRVFIVVVAITVAFILHNTSVSVGSAIMAEHAPELVRETVEFFKKI